MNLSVEYQLKPFETLKLTTWPILRIFYLLASISGLLLALSPQYRQALWYFMESHLGEKIGDIAYFAVFSLLGSLVGMAVGITIGFIISYFVARNKHGNEPINFKVTLGDARIEILGTDFSSSYDWKWISRVKLLGKGTISIQCARPGSATILAIPQKAFDSQDSLTLFYNTVKTKALEARKNHTNS